MIRAAVLGATGYTGQELVRILAQHPQVLLSAVTTQSYGGMSLADVFPHLRGQVEICCSDTDISALAEACDVVFVALPHGVASQIINQSLLDKTAIVDLGADFRLKDASVYEEWYHTEHGNKDLIEAAVYGLPEWNEPAIKQARLLANPGCYATAAALALLPLIRYKLIQPESILIDAKSGVSGAGRSATQAVHYNECNESIKAYALGSHRHTPEIEQQLSHYQANIRVTFIPHLVPMNRGILVTAYASLRPGMGITDVGSAFSSSYAGKPFVRLFTNTGNSKASALPETRWVKGSNYCDIGFAIDSRTNRVIVVSALDNLVKGAAGQAVQNMNIMFGLDQTSGLQHVPLFPA